MKVTLKNFAVFMVILSMVLVVLSAIDIAGSATVSTTQKTSLRVTVVDLDGKPIHNAVVSVLGSSYFTDNKGLSPVMEIEQQGNYLDASVTDWFCVNIKVTAQGYVPTFVYNCVVYMDNTRAVTVRMYGEDSSNLPYVCYVESPPDSYLQQLLQK